MYERIAKELGFSFKEEPTYVEWKNLPEKFVAYIIHSRNGLSTMAMGVDKLTHIVVTRDFPQVGYKKQIIGKPVIFRKFEGLDEKFGYTFISADVSKVYAPAYGNMVCITHPKHGQTKKFAPIGKVYNEKFKLEPSMILQ